MRQAVPSGAVRADPARRFAVTLVGLALAALAIRVAFTVVVDPEVPEIGDAMAYHHLANQLADGDGYIRPFDLRLFGEVRPTAEYPPLFPALISVAARVGVDTVTGQRIVACLFGAAAVAVIGLLGRRAAGSTTVGLVAAGLAAAYPMLFLMDATLMPEGLFTLLVAGTLLAAYRAHDEPSAVRFAVVGGLAGLATLTRAEGALLVLLVAVPLARRPLALLGAAVGAAAAVVLPWTIRNTIRFDEVVPVSNNIGSALDGANCDPTYEPPNIGFWLYTDGGECFDGFGQDELAKDNEAVVARRHRDEGLRYARDHIDDLPSVGAARLLRTWGLYDPADQTKLESLEGRPLDWQRAGTGMAWALTVLAVAGVVGGRRRATLQWPLLATIAMVSLTTVLTYGNQRFRAAAEPALLVLASVALVDAARRLGHRQDRGPEREGEATDGEALDGSEDHRRPVDQR